MRDGKHDLNPSVVVTRLTMNADYTIMQHGDLHYLDVIEIFFPYKMLSHIITRLINSLMILIVTLFSVKGAEIVLFLYSIMVLFRLPVTVSSNYSRLPKFYSSLQFYGRVQRESMDGHSHVPLRLSPRWLFTAMWAILSRTWIDTVAMRSLVVCPRPRFSNDRYSCEIDSIEATLVRLSSVLLLQKQTNHKKPKKPPFLHRYRPTRSRVCINIVTML